MKNLLILPFLFLFFQKINGQTEPRLVKQVVQVYSDSLEVFLDTQHLLYEYDFRGNMISETEINFDDQSEIVSWTGKLMEYDADDFLIKETNRRFNWDVGLWITNDWIEFFYDGDGCLIERKLTPNLASMPVSIQTIDFDNQCLELGYFWKNEDGTWRGKRETEYMDNGNSFFQKDFIYVEVLDSLFFLGGLLKNVNAENDEIELFDFLLFGSGSFFQYTHQLYDFEYQFGVDGNLESKDQITYDIMYHLNYNFHNPLEIYIDTFLSEVATLDYHYCQGLLTKEEIAFEQFDINGNSSLGNRQVLYFYEGKDACFDFENKSTATIYPNPTFGFVQIESPLLASGNTQIRVVDVNGKVMLEQLTISRAENTSLDLEHLANGTYVIQLMSGEYFVSEKLVVVK